MSIDNNTVGAGLDTDLAELRAHLARLRVPTTQDDILAQLVARHAPSRLLWRCAALSRTRRYGNLDEVCAEISACDGGWMPPPPGR